MSATNLALKTGLSESMAHCCHNVFLNQTTASKVGRSSPTFSLTLVHFLCNNQLEPSIVSCVLVWYQHLFIGATSASKKLEKHCLDHWVHNVQRYKLKNPKEKFIQTLPDGIHQRNVYTSLSNWLYYEMWNTFEKCQWYDTQECFLQLFEEGDWG